MGLGRPHRAIGCSRAEDNGRTTCMNMYMFVSILVNGLLIGGVYGLFASGFTFQLGCLSVYNFSFGNWLILSMYITFFLLKVWNIHLVGTTAIIFGLFFLMGFLERRLLLRKGSTDTQIITTIGMGMIINGLILIVFTARPRSTGFVEPMLQITPDIRLGLFRLLIFVLAAAIMFGFQAFLKNTSLGRTIRAVIEKHDTAMLMGIDADNTVNVAFGISFVIMALSGIMLTIMYPITFGASDSFQLMSFLIASLAGLGNMKGAFFAGLIVGTMGALLQFFISSFGDVILYVLIVGFLIARPSGMFARQTRS